MSTRRIVGSMLISAFLWACGGDGRAGHAVVPESARDADRGDDAARARQALEEARSLLESNPHGAMARLELAIALDPRLREARALMGRIHLSRDLYSEAVRSMEAASALGPATADDAETLGRAQMGLGELNDAVTSLEQAVRLDPARVRLLEEVGHIHEAAGRRADAERAYRRSLVGEPPLVSAGLALGRLLLAGAEEVSELIGECRRGADSPPIERRRRTGATDQALPGPATEGWRCGQPTCTPREEVRALVERISRQVSLHAHRSSERRGLLDLRAGLAQLDLRSERECQAATALGEAPGETELRRRHGFDGLGELAPGSGGGSSTGLGNPGRTVPGPHYGEGVGIEGGRRGPSH